MQAAVALTRGEVIDEAALLLQPGVDPVDTGTPSWRPVRRLAGSLALRDAIHDHIRFVLEQVRGNKRKAARELHVARATLERKLKEMGDAHFTGKG